MEKYHKNDVAPIEGENERDETYEASNPQIDSKRTSQNYNLVKRDMPYTQYINERIKSLNLPTKPRKDAVVMNSFVLGSDRTFFDELAPLRRRDFFEDCTRFFIEKYGEENIISAVVHVDETTPHLHLNLIPITNGRLCSKELFNKKQLSALQTEFHEKVGKKYGLERGKIGSQVEHLSTAEYKAQKIIEEAEQIKREVQEYKDALIEAENGKFSHSKGKLKQQAVAAIAEVKVLKKDLERVYKDQNYLFTENRKLRKENETLYPKGKIADTLKKENPQEYNRILRGGSKPTALGNFFSAVLSLFDSPVVRGNSRLQEIEREIEQERKWHEKRNKNFKG